ncbi:hypothetical protein ABFX02_01G005700 [Erythranthe guttata]
MACKYVANFLCRSRHLLRTQNNGMITRLAYYRSGGGGEESSETEEEIFSSEWCGMAFSKMKKWSHSLKEYDLIDGRLVNINDQSRIYDDKLEKKLHTFKSVARVFIGLPLTKETMKKNMLASFADTQFAEFQYFSKCHEREPLIVKSLSKISDILSVSAQQRKVVRHNICPQITEHRIWTGALVEILNGLKSEIEVLIHRRPSKETRLAHQIATGLLKFLESAVSYDPETSSWMRLTPTKGANTPNSPKWEDALEMAMDLINCLSDEEDLAIHVSKLEGMKEGLYQIREVLIDKNIGYKEIRYQEHLVQKKLTKNLGLPSQCLFTLLLYYLYGSVENVEIEVRGGVHAIGYGGKFCLYMGKILTVDEEKIVWNGVKQLDKALSLFKFVWESAGMKGDLVLQGHLWCVGAQNRSISYRGNTYMIHEINL